ncbi:DUF397 domain-containing protein [Actinokineospora cianjurensis]|uniref:Uncharacterized protein DUF397 n=1 Tax=Actinokineospora cianjurensis TaxID=585224 RepID=A0A421AYI1_9PSEU|nr:DUF397 domain-containing protein [Actinokineospora cianjurensis]RLK54851.1 uncharacterized protein DUF397 [Actinokineospora cianjurensis]
MATKNLGQYRWRKSSRSGNQGQCVEVGISAPEPDGVAIRDSKAPQAGVLCVGVHGWASFVATLRLARSAR